MKSQFYFLSPVEVVKVTPKNLQEVAEWCGGKVAQTESRRVQGRMDSYVWVPTPENNHISWAFPGMYITKRLVATAKGELRSTYAVFRRDYFEKNYFESPQAAVDATWEREKKERDEAKANHPSSKKDEVVVVSSVGDAMSEALKKAGVPQEKREEIVEEVVEKVTPLKLGGRIRKVEDVCEDVPEENLSEKLFDDSEMQPVLNPDTYDLDPREEANAG